MQQHCSFVGHAFQMWHATSQKICGPEASQCIVTCVSPSEPPDGHSFGTWPFTWWPHLWSYIDGFCVVQVKPVPLQQRITSQAAAATEYALWMSNMRKHETVSRSAVSKAGALQRAAADTAVAAVSDDAARKQRRQDSLLAAKKRASCFAAAHSIHPHQQSQARQDC
jgi:hypothetical protein